jgi:hypothetical protein
VAAIPVPGALPNAVLKRPACDTMPDGFRPIDGFAFSANKMRHAAEGKSNTKT